MTLPPHPEPELRKQFLLRPDVIYLNHGSFGACPRPVFRRYQTWQRELERQPVAFLGRRYRDLMRAARDSLGAYVGADADDLVYVTNATTGLNVVARSLPLEPGDEVLTTDLEYGALDRTWRFVCRKRGARYVRQPLPLPVASPDDVLEALWAGVTSRTRVLFLSHVTSATALILPVAALVRRAREAGIRTVVDGAHAPGQLPLNLEALGADFYAGNCHKWMLAPKGAAFLHARREVQPLLEPLVVSWGWESATPGPSRFVDEQEYGGTRDISAFLAVPAAIDFMADHAWPEVRRWCHAAARWTRERITALTGLPPLTPDDPAWYGQMVALPLPPCDGEALQRRLYDEYGIEVPVTDWGDRHCLRVSLQAYNTAADVEALVEALAAVLSDLHLIP
jgi:isopenicillin-N epimerase